jgi:hypothetical protein
VQGKLKPIKVEASGEAPASQRDLRLLALVSSGQVYNYREAAGQLGISYERVRQLVQRCGLRLQKPTKLTLAVLAVTCSRHCYANLWQTAAGSPGGAGNGFLTNLDVPPYRHPRVGQVGAVGAGANGSVEVLP